jgi:hypothetical protein
MDFVFPPGTPWAFEDVDAHVIDGQPPDGFDCGREAQNTFLYTRAWRDAKIGVTVTHLLFIKGMLAAYVTLMMDSIVMGREERPKGITWRVIPALKIAQLAVDRRFAGHRMGRFVVGYVVSLAQQVRTQIGCRMITLDAEPDLLGWYESMGFRANDEEQASRERYATESGRDASRLPVSMRFDLREPHG